jgi:exopolyphosphatase/guanosine-5'-triphosphate,3'-diphosphate pyrophosphatase
MLRDARAEDGAAEASSPTLKTAMHIGASSVSMLVCECPAGGGPAVALEFLEQPAPLARDIFRHGKITAATTERIVAILLGFQEAMRELGVGPLQTTRAVATNILGEADNHDVFLNRVRVACGLEMETLDDGEMTRLIYLKTRRRLDDMPAMRQRTTLVVHVGPGNTRALLFQKGVISRYTSYRLGAHRTRVAVERSHAEGAALLRLIREHASGNLTQLAFDYRDVKIEELVVLGYELQLAAPFFSKAGSECLVKTLREIVASSADMDENQLVRRFQLDYHTADALLPALEINLAIAEIFRLKHLRVPASPYEQGLLQDLLVSHQLTASLEGEVVRSAKILASRYQSDPKHGEHVAMMCAELFEAMADVHHLDAHDALLLRVAAIVHECGTFISPRAHHLHSQYILLNSEIFGLGHLDVTIISLLARYHRHSGPKPDHPYYCDLTTAARLRVWKLAALLRVADALERTHDRRVRAIRVQRSGHQLHIYLKGVADAAVERLAMRSKGDLFESVFGLEIILHEEV